MEAVFLKILQMSLSASWLVIAVILLRLFLRGIPKWIHCLLWAMVALRLLCPISIESGLSLVPRTDIRELEAMNSYVGETNLYWENTPEYGLAVEATMETMDGGDASYVITGETPQTPPVGLDSILAVIWLTGMGIMLASAGFSYIRLNTRVRAAIDLDNGIFLCDYIDSPFILGIFRPRIYLPSAMDPNAAAHVLAHERAHIRRKDHWWKPLGFLLLTLHWFNPVLWLAYILLCRDIELACDEKVIREMGAVDKKAYSEALLACSVPRSMVAACPLAFGEVGVKQRIKSVLHYRKPAFWAVAVSLCLCAAVAVCFLTDPKQNIFGEYYQVNAVVYQNPILSNEVVPRTAPDLYLTEEGALQLNSPEAPENWYSLGELREITLTKENFDGYLYWGLGVYPELTVFREQNSRTWTASSIQTSVNDFWYVMEQENGELYAAYGYNGHISWIYRLGALQSHDPFVAAGSPYQWTRNLTAVDVEGAQVTGYQPDGTQQHFELDEIRLHTLVHFLNDISPEAFELGHLQNDRLVTAYIACKKDGKWEPERDILLRYDGEAVDVIFNSGNKDLYPQESGHNWIIRDANLNGFLAQYVQHSDPYLASDTPFQWTAHVKPENISHASVSLHEEDVYTRNLSGKELLELTALLNAVREQEISVYKAGGNEDPFWDTNATTLWLMNPDMQTILLRYAGGMPFLQTETGSGTWETEGPWVIDNDDLCQWLERLSYGGTWMLTEKNREEVRQLLGVNFVEFFDPQRIEKKLFVGCRYADATKLALACFEGNETDGYSLVRLLREEDIHKCESGLDLWYCDYEVFRVFLVLNRDVTGMQWTGTTEKTVPLDRNPAVVAEPFESGTGASYSFLYGDGGASTLPMPMGSVILENSWGYSNLCISVPESWEYEVIPYSEELHSYCVNFRPAGEEGWLRLQFTRDPFGVCGTGLETKNVIVAGMEGTAGYYDGSRIWSYVTLREDLPGDYQILNEGQWLEMYIEETEAILDTLVLGDGMLTDSEALEIALNAAADKKFHNWATEYSFETGIHTISFYTKEGQLTVTVQVGPDGTVYELCSLPLAEETQ